MVQDASVIKHQSGRPLNRTVYATCLAYLKTCKRFQSIYTLSVHIESCKGNWILIVVPIAPNPVHIWEICMLSSWSQLWGSWWVSRWQLQDLVQLQCSRLLWSFLSRARSCMGCHAQHSILSWTSWCILHVENLAWSSETLSREAVISAFWTLSDTHFLLQGSIFQITTPPSSEGSISVPSCILPFMAGPGWKLMCLPLMMLFMFHRYSLVIVISAAAPGLICTRSPLLILILSHKKL